MIDPDAIRAMLDSKKICFFPRKHGRSYWMNFWIEHLREEKKMEYELVPLYDRVVVEPEESEDITEGGLYIPDKAKEKSQKGKVVAVGGGRVLESGEVRKPRVQPGQTIIFGKYAGTEIEINNKMVFMMKEEDIYAILYEGEVDQSLTGEDVKEAYDKVTGRQPSAQWEDDVVPAKVDA